MTALDNKALGILLGYTRARVGWMEVHYRTFVHRLKFSNDVTPHVRYGSTTGGLDNFYTSHQLSTAFESAPAFI